MDNKIVLVKIKEVVIKKEVVPFLYTYNEKGQIRKTNIPVFQWKYFCKKGKELAIISAYPTGNKLHIESKRLIKTKKGEIVLINDPDLLFLSWGWPVPPMFERIIKDITILSKHLEKGNILDFIDQCIIIDLKWQGYL